MALTWTIWKSTTSARFFPTLVLNRAWYLSAGVRRAQRSEHAGAPKSAEVTGNIQREIVLSDGKFHDSEDKDG